MTIILFAILIGFAAFSAVDVLNRRNPIVSRTSFIRMDTDLNQLATYAPTEEGFDFSFGLKKTLDPSIGFYTVRYIER